MSKTIKLAEALLRRKELGMKVNQLQAIKGADIFETKVQRVSVTDSVDNVTAQVAKLTAAQVTAEFDHYAKQLRLIDGYIQSMNWVTEMPEEVKDCFTEYVAPKE